MQLFTLFTNLGVLGRDCGYRSFFGLKPWFYYLDVNSDCSIKTFNVLPEQGVSDFLLIGLVIIDDLLRIAGFVAIGYLIYGGILYVTSQGSPDQTGKAQNTIINALLGLVIAVVAVAFVTFLGSRIS